MQAYILQTGRQKHWQRLSNVLLIAVVANRHMPFESLGEYVKALEQAGELKRVKTKVSPTLEVS